MTNTVCLGPGDENNLGENCKITCRPVFDCHDDIRGAVLLGLATDVAYVCRKCPCNAHNAMCNRHGTKQPKMTSDFSNFRKDFGVFIEDTVSVEYAELKTHYDVNWLDKWPQRKREAILDSQGKDFYKFDRVKNMVKREVALAAPKKARCIQYYENFATQSFLGPTVTAIQKSYTKWFYRRGGDVKITLASGLNQDELGAWMSDCLTDYPNARFYERDGKSWDATMNRQHHEFKMWCYRFADAEILRAIDEGFEVSGCGIYRKGYTSTRLAYTLRGTTKSGHNDTTIGNSLVNAAIAYEAMVRLNLKGDIIVAGDDLLVVVDGDFDADLLAAEESKLGITPEYAKFTHYLDVSFISGIWFKNSDNKFTFTPKPGRLLRKLFWTVNPPTKKKLDTYMRSIVVGVRSVVGDMPIINTFLDVHEPASGEVKTSQYTHLIGTLGPGNISEDFKYKYSITDSEILSAEEFLRANRGRVGLIVHPVIDRIVAIDMADVHERPKVGW